MSVFPRTHLELAQWSRRASEIPDATLRLAALQTHQAKRGNPEGAAAFATLAPTCQRSNLIRALVAFQTMYDYLDTISERPQAKSPENAVQLHTALLVALDARSAEPDYYALDPADGDGGYVRDLVRACRGACEALPSYAAVADRALRVMEAGVEYQGFVGVGRAGPGILAPSAHRLRSAYPELQWWEAAAAGGSSLPVLALLAAAADPATSRRDAEAIERAYFPWIAALHTFLDCLVDQEEDAALGYENLVTQYASDVDAARGLSKLAQRSVEQARRLPGAPLHLAILGAMASYYLTSPEAARPDAGRVRDAVFVALGSPRGAAAVFRLRNTIARIARRSR
jgi:tetraprenyl-beta-curcumene synthase